jgi:nicotinate phosphoribosyltransferase
MKTPGLMTTPDERASTIALATDLYELTMGASYIALGMRGRATFSLFARKLPERRSFLVAAGLDEARSRLASLRFDEAAIDYLRSLGSIRADALEAFSALRFTGDVWAVREGRVVFADEPILEVTAPVLEAQLVETILLNAIHFPSLVATKAARCVTAAAGKALFDFGLRRTPGIEAGLWVARACYLVGFGATSNVLAGQLYGIPVAGTVAHSFIEIFPREMDAFRAFAATFPGPVTLLVDTYDTLRGVARAAELAREPGARVMAVRLDSGDLAALSRGARRILDDAGLADVKIVASGGLDEHALDELVRGGAPIDAFGVGTRVGVSADAPVLDLVYKIVDYEGAPCLKLSTGKQTLVGPKQVYRRRGPDGRLVGDRITARDEPPPGNGWEPLLEPVLIGGRSIAGAPSLDELRALHRAEVALLPPELLDLDGRGSYPVEHSPVLDSRQRTAVAAVREREGLGD